MKSEENVCDMWGERAMMGYVGDPLVQRDGSRAVKRGHEDDYLEALKDCSCPSAAMALKSQLPAKLQDRTIPLFILENLVSAVSG